MNDYFKEDYISQKQFEIVTITKASDIFVTIFYILLGKFPDLSEIFYSMKDAGNLGKGNEISIKKNQLPPARRISNMWPITEIYSKKEKVLEFEEFKSDAKEKDEENVSDDSVEGGTH